MDRYSARRRSRTRERDKAAGDPVTLALSAQIMVVILMMVLLFFIKRADVDGYQSFKITYAQLTGDTQSLQVLIEQARSSPQSGFLDRFQNFVDSLWNAAPVHEDPQQLSSEPEVEEDTPVLDYDLDDEEIAYPDMGYSYLGEMDDLDLDMTLTGQGGGGLPVETVDDQILNPPKGALLSPIIISSYLKPPLSGTVTSEYGYRFHPLTDELEFHTGMDIAALEGTDIYAALAGTVEEVGESEIYGNYVVLDHGGGLKTSYNHCKEILVREGMNMRQGERIALVGSTGWSTGPHLHFEVIALGYNTDPAWLLETYLRLVEEQEPA